jgi:hypothetical protein
MMLCAPCNLKGSVAMTAIYISRMAETNNRDGSMLEGLGLCPSSNAEYAAHGEHLGVVASANREVDVFAALVASQSDMPIADARAGTLLVVNETTANKLSVARDILHEHGAIVVKDPSGKWHFSPYRAAGRNPL